MAELGSVNPIKKLSCSNCGQLLDEDILSAFFEVDSIECPGCRSRIKLPDSVIQKVRATRYLGRNLDVTA